MFRPAYVSLALAAALSTAFPLTASAALFSFTGTVAETPGPAATPDDPNFPPLGTGAQIQFFIDDSDPFMSLDDALDIAGFASTSIIIPGFLTGEASYDPGEGAGIPSNLFGFSAYGSSTLDNPGNPGLYDFLPEGLNGIRFDFPSLGSAPSTVGGLVAAISQPGTTGVFTFEAEDVEGPIQFYKVRAAFPTEPTGVIPLPGTFVLFGSALAGLAALRRSRGSRGPK